MRKGLVPVIRPYKGSTARRKWVRAPGVLSPSRENAYQRAHFTRVRVRALHSVGGRRLRCRKCRYKDVRALQIDHRYGGGSAEHGGINFYYKVLRDPNRRKKYQVLCANCNVIKRRVRQESPLGRVPWNKGR